MSDQLWTVTHATATGEWRSWTVDDETGNELVGKLKNPDSGSNFLGGLAIRTTTGWVVIWLTPGQSLTVENAR